MNDDARDVLYGIPAAEIARMCQVDLKTARGWKQGRHRPPPAALMILSGDLGVFDPAFRGWKLRGGKLRPRPRGWDFR